MVTVAREKSRDSTIGIIRERFFVDIPQTDKMFFQLFADKMGWQVNSKQNLWDEFLKNSPENTDLSEDDILEEIRAVRYGKIQNNH